MCVTVMQRHQTLNAQPLTILSCTVCVYTLWVCTLYIQRRDIRAAMLLKAFSCIVCAHTLQRYQSCKKHCVQSGVPLLTRSLSCQVHLCRWLNYRQSCVTRWWVPYQSGWPATVYICNVFDRISGNVTAKITVYTPHIYGCGQP